MNAIQILMRKKAADPVTDLAAAAARARSNQAQRILQAVWQESKPILLSSLGLGMGIRGAQGLANVVQRNMAPPAPVPPTMNIVKHKVPEKEKVATLSLHPGDSTQVGDWVGTLPIKATAMLGGAYGGYKLTDWLMDKRRKADLQAELAKVRAQYEAALSGNVKTAAEGSLAKDLDELAECVVKKADLSGQLGGGYLTVAGLAAILSGLAGYRAAKSTNTKPILNKAREQQLRGQEVQPIYVNPQTV
jgi:hypothetical protein